MKRVPSSLKNWIDTDRRSFIRTFLLSEGFGFCLLLSCVWGICLDRYGSVSAHLLPGLLIALLAGTAVSVLLMVVWALFGSGEYRTVNAKVNIRLWICASAAVFICWIPVWLAYYPAVFSYDAESQLAQVISGPYSTHHPLLHTLIMGGCMKLMWGAGGIDAGMALYAVLQMMFMATVCGWAISSAHAGGASKVTLWIYGLFCALFPVNPILAVSTTKDVVFSGLILIFVLLIRRYVTAYASGDVTKAPDDKSGSQRGDVSTAVRIGICAAFLVLFRNNSLYALVLMMAVLVICVIAGGRFGRRTAADDRGSDRPLHGPKPVYAYLAVTILAGCVAGCLVNGVLGAVLHAESGSPREALSIPIQQMARTYVLNKDSIDEALKGDLEKILDGDVTERYDPHLADPVKERVYMKEPALFVKTWLRLGLKHPGNYLDAWLLTTEGAWYVADTSVNRIYGEGADTGFGYLSTDIRQMPQGFEVGARPVIPGLKAVLEHLVSDNAFEHIPVIRFLFSPALYVWIMFGSVYASLVRRSRIGLMSMLLPAAVYITVLLGPAILVRYMYPYMLTVILPFMRKKI